MHAELCMHAERWLRKVGCGVTAIDLATAAGEQPDVIGWRYGLTALCEVKVSRADFLADRKKPWRMYPESGMGDWRFYVAPAGLLRAEDMPEGWGLLEWDSRKMQRVHNVPEGNMWGMPPFTGHKRHEALVLCSLIRRLQNPEAEGMKADNRNAAKLARAERAAATREAWNRFEERTDAGGEGA